MTDLERLDEALAAHEDDYNLKMVPDHHLEVVGAARAYRDLVANGERVEWCEVHNDMGLSDYDGCATGWAAFPVGGPSDCRIVSRLLVDPPKEEERDG